MKTIVGVYGHHTDAVKAVQTLKSAGFTENKISLISKAELVNDHIHVRASQNAEKAEISIGAIGGAVVGALTGIGLFAIPGLGFLFGAGALVGAIAGLDIGIIGGGLAAILTSVGVDKTLAAKYEKDLNAGKYLVFVRDESEADIKKAHEVLHTLNLQLELDTH